MGNTFVITPRTTVREIHGYFEAAQLPAHVKVEKLKLICRMAEKAEREARTHFGFRGLEAREESRRFCEMFDQGYETLAITLRCTRRGGSWAWPSNLEKEIDAVRHRRNILLSGYCMNRS